MGSEHYDVDSIIEECQTIFTTLPGHIETLCDNISTSMMTLRDILILKGHMVRMAEKIDRLRQPMEEQLDPHLELILANNVARMARRLSSGNKGVNLKKLRVLPMIKGHVISTASTVHLNRLSHRKFTLRNRLGPETSTLSPIIENSPPTPSGAAVVRELRIPLQRLDVNQINGTAARPETPKRPEKSLRKKMKGDHQEQTVPESEAPALMEEDPQDPVQEMPVEDEEQEDGNDTVEDEESAVKEEQEEEEEEEEEESSAALKQDADDQQECCSSSKHKLTSPQAPPVTGRSEDPLEGPSWLLDRHQSPGLQFITVRKRSTKSMKSAKVQSLEEACSPVDSANLSCYLPEDMEFTEPAHVLHHLRLRVTQSPASQDSLASPDTPEATCTPGTPATTSGDVSYISETTNESVSDARESNPAPPANLSHSEPLHLEVRPSDNQRELSDAAVAESVPRVLRRKKASQSPSVTGSTKQSSVNTSTGNSADVSGSTSASSLQASPETSTTENGRRCRRKAAPRNLKEVPINTKLRRT